MNTKQMFASTIHRLLQLPAAACTVSIKEKELHAILGGFLQVWWAAAVQRCSCFTVLREAYSTVAGALPLVCLFPCLAPAQTITKALGSKAPLGGPWQQLRVPDYANVCQPTTSTCGRLLSKLHWRMHTVIWWVLVLSSVRHPSSCFDNRQHSGDL